MTCYKAGERTRLIYAVRVYRGRKDQPKGFGSRDVRALLVRARIQLGGPIVLVWDNARIHLTADLPEFFVANTDWLTVFQLPAGHPNACSVTSRRPDEVPDESSKPVSDDVLSVIPTNPHWQPEPAAAERAASLVEDLAPGLPDGVDVEIDVTWHDALTVVDCGQNLQKIGCPQCGASIDTEWWADLLEAHCHDGFATLAVVAPCCGCATSLDALEYDWPCGFARFEIAIWNPERAWFSDEELTAIGDALGHPVQQVRAHI